MASAPPPRSAAARWRKLRAVMHAVMLIRSRHGSMAHVSNARRGGGGTRPSQHQAPLKTAALWQLLNSQLFQRVLKKEIQNRSDADVKVLAEFLKQTRFFFRFSSASIDALARYLRFQTLHDGEVVYLQGDRIEDTCGRYLVVQGSLLVYRNQQYSSHTCGGMDYVSWMLASNPGLSRDTIKYGECVNTCSIGDTCGDDAVTGHLFREVTVISQSKTVVATVSQADYRRVVRFNIPSDTSLIDQILALFQSSRGATRTERGRASSILPSRFVMSSISLENKHHMRQLYRFLFRFQCFRMLPQQYHAELAHKLQFCIFQNGEILYQASTDAPKLFVVLTGKVCVHSLPSWEDAQIQEYARTNYSYDPPVKRILKNSKPQVHDIPSDTFNSCYETVSRDGTAFAAKSTHICTLTSGDTFGELSIMDPGVVSQGVILFNPMSNDGPCAVLALPRDDYQASLLRYHEATEFTLEGTQRILTKVLPQDRMGEHLSYLRAYLTRQAPAKVFFNQLPSWVLNAVCSHASLEEFEVVGDEIGSFIQKEDDDVECMRVVLSGYVGVFKSNAAKRNGRKNSNASQKSDVVAPNRAVLRRYESRLIRQGTVVANQGSGRRLHAFEQIGDNSQSLTEEISCEEEEQTLHPVSILPTGTAFGHHQIFTSSKSPYTFVPYSASPCTDGSGSRTTSRNSAALDVVQCRQVVNILVIPARTVRVYFANIDQYLVYNPVRMLKRVIQSKRKCLKDGVSVSQWVSDLGFDRLIRHHAIFKAIPQSKLDHILTNMDIVSIPAQRLVYECGDVMKYQRFLILAGTVRTFSYSNPGAGDRSHPVEDVSRSNRSPKRISKFSQFQSDKQSSMFPSEGYDRLAGDAVFLTSYDQTQVFMLGDSFGQQASSDSPNHGAPSKLTKRSSNIQVAQCSETAVAMTDCQLAVINVDTPTTSIYIDDAEKRELIGLLCTRDDDDNGIQFSSGDQQGLGSVNSLGICLKILDKMRVGTHLSTLQRLHAARALKYCRVKRDTLVYRQGEDSSAIYMILTGKVKLFARNAENRDKEQKATATFTAVLGDHLVDLHEADIFGEEAFYDACTGSSRLTTAVTVNDEPEAKLVYLTRNDYDAIIALSSSDLKTLKLNGPAIQHGKDPRTVYQLMALSQKTTVNKLRWKMAIGLVIQRRTQRSHWFSVIARARQHRVELVFDLAKGLTVFEDILKSQVMNLCAYASVQTFPQESTIFSKGDDTSNLVFMVLNGSVALQQVVPASILNGNIAAGASIHSNAITPSTDPKVTIQIMNTGDIFGDFEMYHQASKRYINAVSASPWTRLVLIPQDDFRLFWPHQTRLNDKLLLLKASLRSVYDFDSEQLCSMYYAAMYRVFSRNEVMSGSSSQAGNLHFIQHGSCIIHNSTSLQKIPRRPTAYKDIVLNSPTRVSLDTRIATLARGSILYTPKQEDETVSDSRKGSLKPAKTSDLVEPTTLENEYAVADSPLVEAFTIQIFPAKPHAAPPAFYRFHEFYAAIMIGKNGLSALRDFLVLQKGSRASNAIFTGRLAAATLPKEPTGKLYPRKIKPRLQLETAIASVNGPPSGSTELTKFLRARQLPHQIGHASPGPSPLANLYGLSPSSPTAQSLASPSKAQLMFGSFLSGAQKHEGGLPLIYAKPNSDIQVQQLSRPLTTASVTTGLIAQQLREEERVFALLPNQSAFSKDQKMHQERQIRRRNGHPPPKIVENAGKFVDEHAFTPVVNLKDVHQRKKSGLCRRLLHVKGQSNI